MVKHIIDKKEPFPVDLGIIEVRKDFVEKFCGELTSTTAGHPLVSTYACFNQEELNKLDRKPVCKIGPRGETTGTIVATKMSRPQSNGDAVAEENLNNVLVIIPDDFSMEGDSGSPIGAINESIVYGYVQGIENFCYTDEQGNQHYRYFTLGYLLNPALKDFATDFFGLTGEEDLDFMCPWMNRKPV